MGRLNRFIDWSLTSGLALVIAAVLAWVILIGQIWALSWVFSNPEIVGSAVGEFSEGFARGWEDDTDG